MNCLLIVIAVAGFASGHGHSGGGSSGSGEHFGNNCTIVPAGTTNCTGVTGQNCSDSTYLAVSSPLIALGLNHCYKELNPKPLKGSSIGHESLNPNIIHPNSHQMSSIMHKSEE